MSNIKSLAKKLPDMSHDFDIELEGQITKIPYEGAFQCKIPNVKDQSAIAKHKAYLNGGFDETLDVGTRNLHHMISYLRYTLTSFPDWWKNSDLGYELYDANIVETVYGKVLEFEQDWMEKVWGTPEEEEAQEQAKEEESESE